MIRFGFGLWIDSDLSKGSSTKCLTFNNQPLTGTKETNFDIAVVEVFSFN
jgi:hypothetical protein